MTVKAKASEKGVQTAKSDATVIAEQKNICGIVMPISAIDGCTEIHWSDVLDILSDAIENAGFEANVVSNADEVGIIQKRIIQNLYENPIVVCDVSGKNPNVMFELGLRLAFDKPTIIVKDDKTSYSFDTSPIEHLPYPRDLRFSSIVEFKQKLSEKIRATHQKATSDSSYTTFLKHFGEFKVARLEQKEVSGQEYMLEELKNIRIAMRRIERNQSSQNNDVLHPFDSSRGDDFDLNICLEQVEKGDTNQLMKMFPRIPEVTGWKLERQRDHQHLFVKLKPAANLTKIVALIRRNIPGAIINSLAQ